MINPTDSLSLQTLRVVGYKKLKPKYAWVIVATGNSIAELETFSKAAKELLNGAPTRIAPLNQGIQVPGIDLSKALKEWKEMFL